MSVAADIEYSSQEVPTRTVHEYAKRQMTVATVQAVGGFFAVFMLMTWLAARSGWSDGSLVWGSVVLFWSAIGALVFWFANSGNGADTKTGNFVEDKWRDVLHRCGGIFPAERAQQPPVRYLHGSTLVNDVYIKLPVGQTPEKLAAQKSAIINAWGVPGMRITQHLGGWYGLSLLAALPLAPPPEVEPPTHPLLVVPSSWKGYLSALPIGKLHRQTTGQRFPYPYDWGLPLLGSHVLVAGETGAGKSSWVQSIISALRPVMAHGAAVLVGIDPKGVELALGRGFFRHYASDYDTIADTLEMVVAEMTKRKAAMAGKSRLVRPNRDMPLWVIFIDELAAVGKLDIDAKRRARTTAAMNLILTQGRALGFSVVGAVQDPTKETLPNRDLFNLRVALRLTAAMTDLVLGPKCREEGVASHTLTEAWAGAGYLRHDGGWALVRADWIDDDAILNEAADFRDGEFTGDLAGMWLPIDEGTPQRVAPAVEPVPPIPPPQDPPTRIAPNPAAYRMGAAATERVMHWRSTNSGSKAFNRPDIIDL